MSIELPPLPLPIERLSQVGPLLHAMDARERILLARVAELDLALSIARQNAELLTGYWKAATAEASAMRNRLREAGLLDEEGDNADGW